MNYDIVNYDILDYDISPEKRPIQFWSQLQQAEGTTKN